MILALATLLVAVADRPFADERLLLDRRLATLRRILPDAPNPMASAALVKDLAQDAKLAAVEALARPPVQASETAARGDDVVDLTAAGRFADVERLFRQVALSHRLIDVESLTLAASPDDSVKLAAVLRVPYRPAKAPLPSPPDGTRARISGVPKPQAEAYLRDAALAVAKTDAIAALRRSRRNPRLFLCELAAVVRDRPAILLHASLADDFVVRGLTVGEGPVRSLQSRFERGFFRVSEFLMRRSGACLQFEVRGQSPVAGAEAELPIPAEDPFDQDDTACRVDRDSGKLGAVKGPNPKTLGKGPLTLRLRDMDTADLFLALHRLTAQGFVVDGDVAGRVSVDLAGVSLDETLSALQKTLGLRVSEAGPVRRVSVARGPAPKLAPAPLPTPGGPPTASFLLKRAELREVLAVMTDLDPTLAALGPPGTLGRASLWASDASLSGLRDAILGVAGLAERFEEDRRLLEHKPSGEETLVPVAGEAPERRIVLRPIDLTVAEFELAGVASSGDAWTAFAYAPTGRLNVYKVGDRLADGSISAINSTDVVLETDDGPLRVLLPPAR
jgi:hypothetical protein